MDDIQDEKTTTKFRYVNRKGIFRYIFLSSSHALILISPRRIVLSQPRSKAVLRPRRKHHLRAGNSVEK